MSKSVLVTGGAKRVGRVIAKEFAKASYKVFVHYNRSEWEAMEVVEEIKSFGAEAKALKADLTKEEEVRAMVEALKNDNQTLTCLVNNAGVFKKTPIDQVTLEDLDFHLNTNLRAPYLLSVLARPLIEDGGVIINVADVAAFRPFREYVPYCISKASVVMLTKAMAKAFAPKIRVCAVAPGTVLFREDEDEELRRRVIAKIPMGRIGTPEDVARAMLFLASSPHITGVVLPVDGGRLLA
jgi:NAD(P)-dependent dehydrogenase (short-subunit alcohol dehydrogenase family)